MRIDFSTREIVDGLSIENWKLGIERWGFYSGGIGGSEGFDGDTLELEGIDAKAGLTRQIDYDAQGNLGFFCQGKADGTRREFAPGNGLLLTLSIADHPAALANYQPAGLHIVHITRCDTEAITTSRECDSLPQTIIQQRGGKTAPLRLELDIVVVARIYMRSCGNTILYNRIGILPTRTGSLHSQTQETTAIVAIDSPRTGNIRVLIISKVLGRNIAMHQSLCIEGEDSQR